MPGPVQTNPIYLVVNCSEADLQVVLGTPERVLWSQGIRAPGRAMKHIAPAIRSGLECLEVSPGDLAGISCVQGPGSFTGIRMAFAHAHGLSLAAKIPMASISYFDALIRGPGKLLHGPAWIFVHSRLNQVYALQFCLPCLLPLSAPVNIDLNSIPGLAGNVEEGPVHVFGSGVRKNPDHFAADYWNILSETWDIPLPWSLLSLCVGADYSRPMPFPEYLRPSDAEEKQELILP